MTPPTPSPRVALESWVEAGIAGRPIEPAAARTILEDPDLDVYALLHAAGRVRAHYFGRRVQVHQLNNVQNGACPEDCGYCGQSKDSTAPIQPYRLKSRQEIIDEAAHAKASGAFRYCMVLSGRGPTDDDIDHMVECISEVKSKFGLETCLSAGLMDAAKAQRLRAAGLDRLNHNLNTSESHYPEICSTHTFRDRMETLRAAREAGLNLCSGLIVGMGETRQDLVDVAFELQALNVESLPVNFLVPIPGNPVTDARVEGRPLTPEFCLRVLCLYRFVNPKAEIRVGAGREGHLRSLQVLALQPANSLFVDGYLLTKGSAVADTIRMIVDAGYDLELDGGRWPDELRTFIEAVQAGGTASFHVDGSGQVIKTDRLNPRKVDLSISAGGEA